VRQHWGSAKIIDGSIGPLDLANGAVRKNNLAAAGGSSGEVLGFDGTNLVWQKDGLTLPFFVSENYPHGLFRIENTNSSGGGVSGKGWIGVSGVGGAYGVDGVGETGVRGTGDLEGVRGNCWYTTGGTGLYGYRRNSARILLHSVQVILPKTGGSLAIFFACTCVEAISNVEEIHREK
jgi:hypothetical protein